MIEQTNDQMTIIPKGDEAQAIFFNRLNEYVKLQYIIDSARESQKDIMNAIADTHVATNTEDKKTDVKKRAALLIGEFLDGKASAEAKLVEDVLGDYSIAQKHLKG